MTGKPTSPIHALTRWFDRTRWGWGPAVLLIYLAAFNGQWRPGADSAEHVVIAQRLLDSQGFTHPTGLQDQLSVGPAYALAAIGLWRDQVDFFISHLALLLSGVAALGLAYLVLRRQYDRPVAVTLAVLLSLTETYYRMCFDLLGDVPFGLGLMLLLLGWSALDSKAEGGRGGGGAWWGWAAIAGGVAIMTLFRSVVVSVLVGVALATVWRVWRGPIEQRSGVVARGLTCLGAWLTARLAEPGVVSHDEGRVAQRLFEELPHTLERMFSENLPRLATEHTAEALLGVDLGPWASVLLLVVMIAAWIHLMRFNALWGFITAAFFAQWLLFMPGDRYFLPVLLPLLAAWWEVARRLERSRWGAAGRVAAIAMIVLWIAPNVVRIGAFIIEQRRVPYLPSLDDGRFVRLEALGAQLRDTVEPDALIVGSEGSLLTWYSGRTVMDPKQLWAEVESRRNRSRIVRLLLDYPRVYVLQPTEAKYDPVMRRLSVELADPVLTTPRREGQTPWTLHPATVRADVLEKLEEVDRKTEKSAFQADKRDDHDQKKAKRQRRQQREQGVAPGAR